MKKKLAIVSQRYGTEVNGGAEYYTKKLVEHLQEFYDVEVMTTAALDYDTWENQFPEGLQIVDGIPVRRFKVKKPRHIPRFLFINKLCITFPWMWRILEPIWLREQGPYCPELISYIDSQKENFDIFMFVTYLYYTTVVGLPLVAEKSILIPTAHDENCIYMNMYKDIFNTPKGIVYLTEEEKKFTEQLFNNRDVPNVIGGSGIDSLLSGNSDHVQEIYGITGDYLIYVGRVDISKRCDEMFEYFTEYQNSHTENLKLVVIGKMMMDKPENHDIICLGFISEDDKCELMGGAKALILPSDHESLSLAVLEAMGMGIPVLVNGICNVLKAHCEKSGAGLSYVGYEEFQRGLEWMLSDKKACEKMRDAGKRYVRDYYSWDKTIDLYRLLIES